MPRWSLVCGHLSFGERGLVWGAGPADLVYCIAINLCTCICKVVEHSPGGPFPHRNPLLHRSNLQSLVQFHRQCHVQLPGLLPQNILLDRVRRAAAPRTAAVQAFDSAP